MNWKEIWMTLFCGFTDCDSDECNILGNKAQTVKNRRTEKSLISSRGHCTRIRIEMLIAALHHGIAERRYIFVRYLRSCLYHNE